MSTTPETTAKLYDRFVEAVTYAGREVLSTVSAEEIIALIDFSEDDYVKWIAHDELDHRDDDEEDRIGATTSL